MDDFKREAAKKCGCTRWRCPSCGPHGQERTRGRRAGRRRLSQQDRAEAVRILETLTIEGKIAPSEASDENAPLCAYCGSEVCEGALQDVDGCPEHPETFKHADGRATCSVACWVAYTGQGLPRIDKDTLKPETWGGRILWAAIGVMRKAGKEGALGLDCRGKAYVPTIGECCDALEATQWDVDAAIGRQKRGAYGTKYREGR